jgi:protein dithiol oxidoreductase (disulfide-forming)
MHRSKWIKSVLSILFAAFAGTAAFTGSAVAQDIRNPDIKPLNPPQPVENDGKIEVLEFFGYGCIHCAHLEPRLHDWAKKQPADVKLVRVPVGEAKGIKSVPLYYTLDAMGQVDRLHQKIFDAVHAENVILGNPATLNKWLEANGVDPKKYEEMQKSFSVQNKIRRAEKMLADYRVTGTPTMIVNGRDSIEQYAGAERLIGAMDESIATARASMKPTAAPADAAKKDPAKKDAPKKPAVSKDAPKADAAKK